MGRATAGPREYERRSCQIDEVTASPRQVILQRGQPVVQRQGGEVSRSFPPSPGSGPILCAPLDDGSPDKEDDNGTYNGADEPGTLSGRIPSKRLSEIARNDCSHD